MTFRNYGPILTLLIALNNCGTSSPAANAEGPIADTVSTAVGHLIYSVGTGSASTFYRVSASLAAAPTALDAVFDAVSPGRDEKMSLSRNGTYVAVDSTRFGCGDYACLARINVDGSAGEQVLVGGLAQHVYSTPPAISSDGSIIVFTQQDELTNKVNLFATTRVSSGVWGTPVLLTSGSTFSYNRYPAFSPKNDYIVFGCNNDASESSGNSICEVAIAGTGFRVVLAPAALSGGINLHHPSYAPDASLVFEGENANGEQVWRLSVGSSTPALVNGIYSNDNTPCVLPNAKILSYWLGRAGSVGNYHEIKMMAADGTSEVMVSTEVDIADSGLSCSD